jgi:hypothetical protein
MVPAKPCCAFAVSTQPRRRGTAVLSIVGGVRVSPSRRPRRAPRESIRMLPIAALAPWQPRGPLQLQTGSMRIARRHGEARLR